MKYVEPYNSAAFPDREGKYVTANPVTGLIGSMVPGEALEHPMREIVHVIEESGLTPTAADLTQLYQAIIALLQTNDLPAGVYFPFAGEIAPIGFLKCDGRAYSRSQYAKLYAAIGTRYGAGDGSTTFQVPDLRGVVPRGLDDGRNLDPGRVLGSYQDDMLKSHRHLNGMADKDNSFVYGMTDQDMPGLATMQVENNNGIIPYQGYTSYTGGAETRMKNIACLYIIKY